MASGNQPAAKFRLGYVSATVWKNDDFYNVTLSKSYKDGDEWKDNRRNQSPGLQRSRRGTRGLLVQV